MRYHAAKLKFMSNRNFHKLFSILCLAFLAFGANSQDTTGTVIDKVVAVIGENIVLLSDIEERIDEMSLSDIPVTENTRCQILEDQMYQKLFLNRAAEDSIEVSEEQLEQELSRRMGYFIQQLGSEEALEDFYGKRVDEIKDDFRDEVEDILKIQQMQQKVVGETKVSPAEVKAFYNSIPKDSIPYINAEAEISQIVKMPPISPSEEKRIKDKLLEFKQRVEENGEDFGTLAYLYSQDPGSAMQNGELGFIGRNELVPQFSAAAFSLEPGEVSDIVKTQFGYHLIQMTERKGERINVKHILLIPQVLPTDLYNAKVYLDSLKREILASDSLTFANAADLYSDDEASRNSGGRIINPTDGTFKFDLEQLGQIDNNLFFTIEKMKPGDIAGPELFIQPDGKKAYRLVKLNSVSEPHVANLKDDYYRLQEIAKRRKENEKLETWIESNRHSAYIYVDPAFAGCPFKTNWNIASR